MKFTMPRSTPHLVLATSTVTLSEPPAPRKKPRPVHVVLGEMAETMRNAQVEFAGHVLTAGASLGIAGVQIVARPILAWRISARN